jgi:exportin-2 (importin alpha re-exporter)
MAELQEIGQLLLRSLNPTEQKAAEEALRQREAQPGFSILLLHVVASPDLDQALRLAAALYFKNFIKRSWTVCEAYWEVGCQMELTLRTD